jgi:hypothetical protein
MVTAQNPGEDKPSERGPVRQAAVGDNLLTGPKPRLGELLRAGFGGFQGAIWPEQSLIVEVLSTRDMTAPLGAVVERSGGRRHPVAAELLIRAQVDQQTPRVVKVCQHIVAAHQQREIALTRG